MKKGNKTANSALNKRFADDRAASNRSQEDAGLSVAQRLGKLRREAAEKAAFAAKLTNTPPPRRR